MRCATSYEVYSNSLVFPSMLPIRYLISDIIYQALLFSFAVTRCLFVSSHRVRHESRDHDTSASTIRVNNLLQCSLLFSLSTLVLCSIFHQWLRLYQPRPHAPVEQAYALFKTRATTLHRWNIRRGLAILPLFLQMAVVLFLGALLEPLKILGRSCSTVVPVLGMMVFVRYIWGLTKVENTVDAVEP